MADDPETPTVDVPPAPDPEAPFGRREDGTPYKRDPSFFAHLRKPAGGRKATRRTAAGPKPPQPAPSRPARPSGKPEYAKRIVQLGALGLPLVPNPVDRAIAEMILPQWATTVERLAIAYPALGQLLDKVLLSGETSGPLLDFVMVTASAGGLIALNHGATHPLLVAMFGAQLQALTAQAMQQQAADQRQAEDLRAMLRPAPVDDQAPAEVVPPTPAWTG